MFLLSASDGVLNVTVAFAPSHMSGGCRTSSQVYSCYFNTVTGGLRCGCCLVSSVFSCYMLVFKADSLYYTFNLSNYSLTPDVVHYWGWQVNVNNLPIIYKCLLFKWLKLRLF